MTSQPQDDDTIDRYDRKMLALLNGPFNHKTTREEWACLDKDGNDIPWFCYPAIEYLEELDISEKTVFEYGSGHSSRYWARRAKNVISVDQNPEWYEKGRENLASNQTIILQEDEQNYANEIKRHGTFDIIVIDGAFWRLSCALAVEGRLNKGGVIILDNSEWYVKAAEQLRSYGYLQVDMKGFCPINPYCTCTTFFFDRAFDFPKRHKFQPVHGLGGRELYAQEDWPEGAPDPSEAINK